VWVTYGQVLSNFVAQKSTKTPAENPVWNSEYHGTRASAKVKTSQYRRSPIANTY